MLYTLVYEVHPAVDGASAPVVSHIQHFGALPLALDHLAGELGDDEKELADQLVLAGDRRIGTWSHEDDGDGLTVVWTLIENSPERGQ